MAKQKAAKPAATPANSASAASAKANKGQRTATAAANTTEASPSPASSSDVVSDSSSSSAAPRRRSDVGDSAAAARAAAARERHARAFLSDDVIARHWFFRLLMWINQWWFKGVHSVTHEGLTSQPRDRSILFYSRHSTTNHDILSLLALTYEVAGRIPRALLHRLIVRFYPLVKYIGGVAGERASAIALLQSGFWSGVLPGGADEGLIGHENCYRVHWPKSRVGFVKVAMEADALIVPFFTRNNEEARWNPILELWHALGLYKPYNALVRAHIPIVSSALHTLGHCAWFTATFFQLPVPVRCHVIFGSPVPYDKAVDSTADVAERARLALQALIEKHQPDALQGRNYMRALSERWDEWRVAYPKLCRTVERYAPRSVKRFLTRWAKGRKQQKRN